MLELEMVWNGELHTFRLDDGEHKVGRAPDNQISVPVASVSKNHAVLRIEGDRLFVRDIGSTNGTDIEGQVLTRNEETEVPPHATVRFAGIPLWRQRDETDQTATTFFSRDEELASQISYRPSEGFTENARTRIVEMLSSLFELVASEADAQELEKSACAFVAKWVKADRVVLLENEGEGTELQIKAHWMRGDKVARDKLKLSNTIVGEVLKDRSSLLVTNTAADPRFAAQQSVMALDLRSAMAAPLFDNQRVRGILYVDSSSGAVAYSKEDLQVLTATSNAVAIKLRTLSLEKEIRTAARIQRAMLPKELPVPAGFELEAHQVMCRQVGGDLYHCLPRPNGTVLLVLGDVAGKGIPASLAMAACLVLVRSLAEIGQDLDELIPHLNRQLFESLAPEQFVTVFAGDLQAETGSLRYVNAGHEPPLLVRAETGEIEELPSGALPVAMLPDNRVSVGEAHLEPGDLLAIFSDGIPEATRDGDSFLEIEPVKKVLVEKRGEPLRDIRKSIVHEVEAFLGKEPPSDDVTLLLLRRQRDEQTG
jgi:putative methionine-R-sulfoxide reductase with GAF domain